MRQRNCTTEYRQIWPEKIEIKHISGDKMQMDFTSENAVGDDLPPPSAIDL